MTPPESAPAPLAGARESSSSKNSTHGFARRALAKISRTCKHGHTLAQIGRTQLQTTQVNMGKIMTRLTASQDVGSPESLNAYTQQRDSRPLDEWNDRVWVPLLPVFQTLQCTC